MTVVGSFIRSHDVSPRGRSRKRGVWGWKRGLSAADQLSSVQRRRGLLNLGNGRGISCSWEGKKRKKRREKRRYSDEFIVAKSRSAVAEPVELVAGPRVSRLFLYFLREENGIMYFGSSVDLIERSGISILIVELFPYLLAPLSLSPSLSPRVNILRETKKFGGRNDTFSSKNKRTDSTCVSHV